MHSGLDVAEASGIVEQIRYTADGLVGVVVVEHTSSAVLMVAWMNSEALERTLTTREATYYSRSRKQLWVKGESSGNTQHVREIRVDCDGDALLMRVDQKGPACHTGTHSCFDGDERILLSAAE